MPCTASDFPSITDSGSSSSSSSSPAGWDAPPDSPGNWHPIVLIGEDGSRSNVWRDASTGSTSVSAPASAPAVTVVPDTQQPAPPADDGGVLSDAASIFSGAAATFYAPDPVAQQAATVTAPASGWTSPPDRKGGWSKIVWNGSPAWKKGNVFKYDGGAPHGMRGLSEAGGANPLLILGAGYLLYRLLKGK